MMQIFAQGLLASEKRIRGLFCFESCDGHPQFQRNKSYEVGQSLRHRGTPPTTPPTKEGIFH